MYKQAGKVNKGSHSEVLSVKDSHPENEIHKRITKSQAYIGYKILWIIKLFLAGKKFPNGNISERKWRSYVHDIIQFVTNKEMLLTFLYMDSEAFFQVIAILFYEGKACDFVK